MAAFVGIARQATVYDDKPSGIAEAFSALERRRVEASVASSRHCVGKGDQTAPKPGSASRAV